MPQVLVYFRCYKLYSPVCIFVSNSNNPMDIRREEMGTHSLTYCWCLIHSTNVECRLNTLLEKLLRKEQ